MPTYAHQELDPLLVRRFRWSVNVLSHRFDEAALIFLERLRHDCPAVVPLAPAWNRQNRFTMAARFADIIKHIEHPTVQVARLRRAFLALGVTRDDMLVIQTSLLHACREAAGTMWNDQMEADWAQVVGSVFELMRSDRPRAVPDGRWTLIEGPQLLAADETSSAEPEEQAGPTATSPPVPAASVTSGAGGEAVALVKTITPGRPEQGVGPTVASPGGRV
jgi:hypothetical protein